MKRSPEVLRDDTLGLVRLVLFGLAILSCTETSASIEEKPREHRETRMHKAQLTQRGYIQFLRWELPVPEITEFTFCLWMESNDLTHPHSIFSYSKNERERLARSWISPHGSAVYLEIGGKLVCSAPVDIRENRWYHVCASWENRLGRYGVWIDGRLWAWGRSEETVDHAIPSGGDIVLGQEYTDFDKGLEDGIEGSVLGFNLLLASAFDPPDNDHRPEATHDSVRSPSDSSYDRLPFFARIPTKLTQRGIDHGSRTVTRTRTRNAFLPISLRGRRDLGEDRSSTTTNRTRSARDVSIEPRSTDPLGLQLAKLSYVRCEIGRGSPFIGGPLMLISWTRTPVRVFGGATLKNVKSDCGNF